MQKMVDSWYVVNGRYLSDLATADLARQRRAEREAREAERRRRFCERQFLRPS